MKSNSQSNAILINEIETKTQYNRERERDTHRQRMSQLD
jgi:hypothetical protein